MINVDPKQDERMVDTVVEAFELGRLVRAWALGGTATAKYAVETSRGRFVLRVRPSEFANDCMTRFDHQALSRLAAAGLPVPCPHYRSDGASVLRIAGRTVEVLSWVEGEPCVPGDRSAARNVGRFLARFHATLKDDVPRGKEGFLREDHPDLLLKYVWQIMALCDTPAEAAAIRRIGEQIEHVRCHLDGTLWPHLPKAVTHGDIHPGNVRFADSQVVAVYDFDYLSVQPRVHDIVHALIFFAARRDSALEPSCIRSLTQPFVLDAELSCDLLSGYQEISQLADVEWEAMPLIVRSQWAQFRLRGSRKVPPTERAPYVLDRYWDVVEWLDRSGNAFFRKQKQISRGSEFHELLREKQSTRPHRHHRLRPVHEPAAHPNGGAKSDSDGAAPFRQE